MNWEPNKDDPSFTRPIAPKGYLNTGDVLTANQKAPQSLLAELSEHIIRNILDLPEADSEIGKCHPRVNVRIFGSEVVERFKRVPITTSRGRKAGCFGKFIRCISIGLSRNNDGSLVVFYVQGMPGSGKKESAAEWRDGKSVSSGIWGIIKLSYLLLLISSGRSLVFCSLSTVPQVRLHISSNMSTSSSSTPSPSARSDSLSTNGKRIRTSKPKVRSGCVTCK